MTVGELKKQLIGLGDDMRVVVSTGIGFYIPSEVNAKDNPVPDGRDDVVAVLG